MKTALLASYEKDAALLRLGGMLQRAGWNILGTAGTAKFLNENGISCRDIAEIVGAPILGHRVVSLSREIHAALLARDEDEAELKSLGIPRIDLVYVTLYPLEKTLADPKATLQDVIEKTDIGGPTLLRAAWKGGRIAISDPSQIDEVEQYVKSGNEQDREALSMRLAAATERRISQYTGASATFWEKKAM